MGISFDVALHGEQDGWNVKTRESEVGRSLSCQSLIPFQKTAPHRIVGSPPRTMCPMFRPRYSVRERTAVSDIPYPGTPQPDIPTLVPEVEPDPGEGPDLLPQPSEPPGDDVPKVGQ